jgi:hypothetical protein
MLASQTKIAVVATALGLPDLQSTTGINAKLKLDYRSSGLDTVGLA